MREGAQCQKWGVLNINDRRCSMPTMWGTQCHRGKLLNLNEGERSKPMTGGAACQQGVVLNTNEEAGRGWRSMTTRAEELNAKDGGACD